MIFEPEPGMSIDLHNESIEFVPVEAEGRPTVFVYAESGKEGTVYKVLKGEEFYALKVFYPEYRNRRLLENTNKLSRFKDLEGFRVAERTIINRQLFPDVIASYPELHYSVLMPWIEGTVWGNLQSMEDSLLERNDYLQIAQSLIGVVSKLEARGLAHCDLSNNNFIIDPKFSSIQLIDIEDMYAPDMPRPVPDISYGTPGYRTKWIAQDGLWGSESDRFASAILCAEILAWHDPEIRRNKAGTVSYFDEEEIGQNSERYSLMKEFLAAVDPEISLLFEKAWFASAFDECPPVIDWLHALEKVTKSTSEIQEERLQSSPELLTTRSRKKTQGAGTAVPMDLPPKMQVSPFIIDFGTVKHPDVEREIEISNTGGSLLTGTIHSEVSWIDVSQDHFSLEPGESCAVTLSLNTTLPRAAKEYRPPNALVIESNDVREVVGATYKVEGMFSNQLLFGWVFLGLITIVLFGNYFSNIPEQTPIPSPFYFGGVGLLAGLATKAVRNFRAFQDILKAAAIAGGITIISRQLMFDLGNGNLTGTLTLNLILLILLMLVFAKAVNRDKAALEKQPAEALEPRITKEPVHESRANINAKNEIIKNDESEQFVYVIVREGIPLYESLPASNSWSVWLSRGSKLSLSNPKDARNSIGKYGHYVEVTDSQGNHGFVAAHWISIKNPIGSWIDEKRVATGLRTKRKARKTGTGSVYVFVADGTALYASLPASNNWIVWLENGAELSPVEPLENVVSTLSKYGYYIEVIDKDGHRGFVTATAVKLRFS